MVRRAALGHGNHGSQLASSRRSLCQVQKLSYSCCLCAISGMTKCNERAHCVTLAQALCFLQRAVPQRVPSMVERSQGVSFFGARLLFFVAAAVPSPVVHRRAPGYAGAFGAISLECNHVMLRCCCCLLLHAMTRAARGSSPLMWDARTSVCTLRPFQTFSVATIELGSSE